MIYIIVIFITFPTPAIYLEIKNYYWVYNHGTLCCIALENWVEHERLYN